MNPSLLPDEKLRLRGEKKGLMDLVQKVVCAENGVSLTLCGCVIDTRWNSLDTAQAPGCSVCNSLRRALGCVHFPDLNR